MTAALLETHCPDLQLIARGKVRDIYRVDSAHLLFVATDRLSAYDVIMLNGIANKGKILTQLSVFWFTLMQDVLPNHLVTACLDEMPAVVQKYREQLEGRCLLVRSFRVLPIEAIVRGYLAGSGWNEYKQNGTVCGMTLEAGLKECQQLPRPLFTPSTKAELGQHDENIHPDKVKHMIGEKLALEMESKAIALFEKASAHAKERGIIIADTKFEFGVDDQGTLYLIDEALTPDSSRFWPANTYEPGRPQDSFDKQFVRDYLTSIHFNKTDPVHLPEEIVQKTFEKYTEAYKLLTGRVWSEKN